MFWLSNPTTANRSTFSSLVVPMSPTPDVRETSHAKFARDSEERNSAVMRTSNTPRKALLGGRMNGASLRPREQQMVKRNSQATLRIAQTRS